MSFFDGKEVRDTVPSRFPFEARGEALPEGWAGVERGGRPVPKMCL